MRVQWTIVVTAETGDDVEATMRLRGLLKVAGRRFGMRCEEVSEVKGVAGRSEVGAGKGSVCPGWRSASGQGRFW